VTVSPVNPQRVWATVEADDKGGIYRSDNGGRTWQLLNDGFNMTSRQYYYGHIFADPQDVNTVYTFCAKYFYKSTDGGRPTRKCRRRTATTTICGSIRRTTCGW
jgi:hypothetical protein